MRWETGRNVLLREEVARGSKIVSAPERRMREQTDRKERKEEEEEIYVQNWKRGKKKG